MAYYCRPGLGFAKKSVNNHALLASLDRMGAEVGVPFAVGHSRKRFLDPPTAASPGEGPSAAAPRGLERSAPQLVARRDWAGAAVVAWATARRHVALIRTHRVGETVAVRDTFTRIRRAAS
eukprot:Polyplicarium_translucidae@DN1647_c0_g1_i2.p4